ncbi:MAG: oligosaccharide flippase family protein [Chloroflexi bacterium]|nr:oligosaccharide flippase family protein [Chloroflexota bacterium]
MNLARRGITSITWNVGANVLSVGVLIIRSVLLARLLPVEVFGVYALAGSVVVLSGVLVNFGMSGAFLHRAPESEDEGQAAAVHFTLKFIFTLVWAIVLITFALVFTGGPTFTALLWLTITRSGYHLTQTARLILIRRVIHQRLAVLQLLNVFLTTLVALAMAWQGATLWALLATDIVTLILTITAFYIWKPVWRPRLVWSWKIMRYYLRFGSRNFLADALLQALDRVDDLWTGLFLNETALGLYSRAYTFATYPSQILTTPIKEVAEGTYAELKNNYLRLSQAFFRINAFLVRSGFFLAGLLVVVAPEFITLVLGQKWLPMLNAFRLMLVFTLLDPIKVTIAHLFIAVGRPDQVARTRLVQLLILGVGLFLFGFPLGITGVALAVDLMALCGIVILLWQARAYVDFSPKRLFLVPGLALALSMIASLSLTSVTNSEWWLAVIKSTVFIAIYSLVLVGLERHEALEIGSFFVRRGLGRGGKLANNLTVEE